MKSAYKTKAQDVERTLEKKEEVATEHIEANCDKLMTMKHKLDGLIEKHEIADGERCAAVELRRLERDQRAALRPRHLRLVADSVFLSVNSWETLQCSI